MDSYHEQGIMPSLFRERTGSLDRVFDTLIALKGRGFDSVENLNTTAHNNRSSTRFHAPMEFSVGTAGQLARKSPAPCGENSCRKLQNVVTNSSDSSARSLAHICHGSRCVFTDSPIRTCFSATMISLSGHRFSSATCLLNRR